MKGTCTKRKRKKAGVGNKHSVAFDIPQHGLKKM